LRLCWNFSSMFVFVQLIETDFCIFICIYNCICIYWGQSKNMDGCIFCFVYVVVFAFVFSFSFVFVFSFLFSFFCICICICNGQCKGMDGCKYWSTDSTDCMFWWQAVYWYLFGYLFVLCLYYVFVTVCVRTCICIWCIYWLHRDGIQIVFWSHNDIGRHCSAWMDGTQMRCTGFVSVLVCGFFLCICVWLFMCICVWIYIRIVELMYLCM